MFKKANPDLASKLLGFWKTFSVWKFPQSSQQIFSKKVESLKVDLEPWN